MSGNADLEAMFEADRRRAVKAGFWYELRYWLKLPENNATGTRSHWSTIGFYTMANSASIVAGSLYRERGWYCELWTCSPVVDPDIPPVSSAPVAWHRCGTMPEYWDAKHRRWEPGADPTI